MKRTRKKLQASTIVETLTALVLVSLAFGGGTMVYLQVLQNQQMTLKTKATLTLHQVAEQTLYEKRYLEEIKQVNGLWIEQKVNDYQGMANVLQIHLIAYDLEDKPILEQFRLVYLEE